MVNKQGEDLGEDRELMLAWIGGRDRLRRMSSAGFFSVWVTKLFAFPGRLLASTRLREACSQCRQGAPEEGRRI